jgi:hypothetical protein
LLKRSGSQFFHWGEMTARNTTCSVHLLRKNPPMSIFKEATSEELQWACNALDTVSLLAFATWRDLSANYVCRVALTVYTVQTQLKLICELGESKGQRLAGSHNPFCDACWCSTRISTQKRAGKCPAAATTLRIYIRSEDFRT